MLHENKIVSTRCEAGNRVYFFLFGILAIKTDTFVCRQFFALAIKKCPEKGKIYFFHGKKGIIKYLQHICTDYFALHPAVSFHRFYCGFIDQFIADV